MTGACLTGCSCVACRMRELLSADRRRLPSRIADTLFQRRGALSGVVLTCGCLRVAEIYKSLALTVNLKCARPRGRTRPHPVGQMAPSERKFFTRWHDLHFGTCIARTF